MSRTRVYILGRSRSGTTILRKLLSGVDGVCITNEKSIYTKPAREIRLTEALLFCDHHSVFGDKGGDMTIPDRLRSLGLPCKYIFIYRDARDSVASGIKKSRGVVRDWWNTADPTKGSRDWAMIMRQWEDARSRIKESDYIEIRFEDFFDRPTENERKLATFLNINCQQIVNSVSNHMRLADAHIGRWRSDIPNWREVFVDDAQQIMKERGYV